jgi:hypothetical protein
VFHDIVKAVDEPQDQAHYLFTIVPIMRPVGINPSLLQAQSTYESIIEITTDFT